MADQNGYMGIKKEDGDGPANELNDKANEYVRDLLNEKSELDSEKCPLIARIIDSELTKVQTTGRISYHETRFLDVFRDKPVKVSVKVLVPIKENPKFNFVGKLLGPKGGTLKSLQDETLCKMAILGRGSMRDKQKEEEFRTSGDVKYAHLNEELHVEVSALGPPAEAHARIAYALAELKKYLIPDPHDNIRQEQMRELVERGGIPPPHQGGPRGPPPMGRGPPQQSRPPGRAPLVAHPPQMHHHQPRAITTTVPQPPNQGGPMRSKAKVMSILDRARSAMEDQYYPEQQSNYQEPPRDDFYYDRRPNQPYYDEPEYQPPPPPQYDRRGEGRGDYAPKISSRDVGSRRPAAPAGRGYRTAPYERPHK